MAVPSEKTIIAALDDFEQGDDIDEILARYPEMNQELRPLLETAAGLSGFQMTPSSEARAASRHRFLAEAQRLRRRKRPENAPPIWRRVLYAFTSLAVLLLLLGILFVPPADDAIPGDLLYPVKRSAESARLFMAPQAEKEALLQTLEQERNREVYKMLDAGRDGRAGYVGIVRVIGPEYWEIGHITARIVESTEIDGDAQVGARVEAHCLIKDGQVTAESLTILEPPDTLAPPQDG